MTEQDISPNRELLQMLNEKIKKLEMECVEDCKRYEDEAQLRVRDRWYKFTQEVSYLSLQRDSVIKAMSTVEAFTMRPILVKKS
jgi:hypothetical protein